jgi:hypothetical protein
LSKQAGKYYKTMANDLESLQRFVPANAAQIGDIITRVNVEADKFKLLIPSSSNPPANPTT